MEYITWIDNIWLWSMFALMVWLRFFKDWFQPRHHHTDHLVEIAIAMPFNYLSQHWSLEALIVLLTWWTVDEWRYQVKGRSYKEQIKLSWEKAWG